MQGRFCYARKILLCKEDSAMQGRFCYARKVLYAMTMGQSGRRITFNEWRGSSASGAKSLVALWGKVLHELSNRQPSQQDTTGCSRTVLNGVSVSRAKSLAGRGRRCFMSQAIDNLLNRTPRTVAGRCSMTTLSPYRQV